MMPEESEAAPSGVLRQSLGTLEVTEEVFRDLVRKVARDVPGVASVGRPSGLFRRTSAADAVQVERGEGEVAFSIGLTVCYDVRIPELVEELRGRVKSTVESITGYRVRAIHITVEHILPPEEGARRPPEGAAVPPPLPGQE